jgi:hypothetical protein
MSPQLTPYFHRLFNYLWEPTEEASQIFYEPSEDEELEMVITSAPEVKVAIDVVYGAIKLVGTGVVISAFAYGYFSLRDIMANPFVTYPWLSWTYLQALVIPPMAMLMGLPFVYYLSTWKLKYYRLVVFTKIVFKIVVVPNWLSFPPLRKQVDIYVSDGSTVLLEETQFKTKRKEIEMGDEEKNRTGFIVDFITGGEASKIGAGHLLFYSRLFGAADFFENIAYGWGWRKCLKQVSETATEIGAAKNVLLRKIIDLKLEQASESEINRVKDEYAAAYRRDSTKLNPANADGRGINIVTVEDPGKWDPTTGKKYDDVIVTQPVGRDMSVFNRGTST